MAKEENVLLLNTALNATDLSQKIRISPIGKAIGIDGRVFNVGENVLTNTLQMDIDLVLDKNHWGEEALGWFAKDSLEIKDDGIYASLELTPEGKTLIENKSYKYLSPVYDVDSTNRSQVLRIVGVGLVNMPNLLKDALNKQQQGDNVDEEKYKAKIEELKKQNEDLQKQVETLKQSAKEAEKNAITQKVENAIKIGEMLPARKDNALALNGTALDNFLEVCKSEAQMTLEKNDFGGDKPKGDEQIDEDVKKQLGLED